MKPYYEHGGITIYHGDFREILPSLRCDVVLTDPPYGVLFRGNEWDAEIPDWLPCARQVARAVMFTTGTLTLWDYPRPDWVLCWARPASNSRSKVGGFSHWSPVMVYGDVKFDVDFLSLHAMQYAAPAWNDHPTPKPVRLFRWLLAGVEAKTVIDPFCGSGSALVAAKDSGIEAIGIELDEKYCELAATRLSQEVFSFEVATAERGEG